MGSPKAIKVAQTEVSEDTIPFEYGGTVYNLPPNLPLDALEAMEEDKIVRFLKATFGDQWVKFKGDFNTADLIPLADALADAYGDTLPG